MKIKTNKVFRFLEKSTSKITVNQGGARSGKTYNILIWLTKEAMRVKKKVFSICREAMPALTSSAMRDFFEIHKDNGMYDKGRHNKSKNEYIFNDNLFEFFSLDDEQKVRGRKRDYLFVNEANECKYTIWKQLIYRTSTKIIIDYNPSDEFHWIYDKIIPRIDADFLRTTHFDNPFLVQSIRDEIERLKEEDPDEYRVFGLGEKGVSRETIYPKWIIVSHIPEGKIDFECAGLDFGFNNPSSLIRVVVMDKNNLYVDELLHQTRMTNKDLIDRFKFLVDNRIEIKADSAEPKTIAEIKAAGFNIKAVKKGDGSVINGIKRVKKYNIRITKRSVNVIKEIKNYKFKKDRNDIVTDEPITFNDHAMDAMRYAIMKAKENKLIPKAR